MGKTLMVGGHGIGDCILAIQCASIASRNDNVDIKISARQEVFDALSFVFGDWNLSKIDESYASNNQLLQNDAVILKAMGIGYDNFYYSVPDLLFSNPHAFDYQKFGVSPNIVKTTRLLTHRRIGRKSSYPKQIYLGLMTSTEGYNYPDIVNLAKGLANQFPNYEIYFPTMSKWAGKDVPEIFIENKPHNLTIVKDAHYEEWLTKLRHCSYFIGTDNGPSHIAYQYGIPRLILDPQYGKLPWIARWKEDVTESIPINVSAEQVINIVKTNLEIPATLLIPRGYVANNPSANWKENLIIKY